MHAFRPSEVLRQHGTVKADQTEFVVKVGQQCCQIAVSAKDLRIFGDQAEVQMRQQII